MSKTYEFNAEIKEASDIDGAYIEIPFDIKAEFGRGGCLYWHRLTACRMTAAWCAWARRVTSSEFAGIFGRRSESSREIRLV